MVEIPCVSQLAIEAGVFITAPETRWRLSRRIHDATSVGVFLDDCIDFVHRANSAGQTVTPERQITFSRRFQKACERYIKRHPEDRNFNWFVQGIVLTESFALSQPREYWNPETARKYRESVNGIWAIYFGALIDDGGVKLDKVFPLRHEDLTDKVVDFIGSEPFGPFANLRMKQIYLGSMIFQTISDWEKREFGRKNNIPGFGSVGYEDIDEDVAEKTVLAYLNQYLQMASETEMRVDVLQYMAKLLRIAKRVPKSVLFGQMFCDWHYS